MGQFNSLADATKLKALQSSSSVDQNGYIPSDTLDIAVPASAHYQHQQQLCPLLSLDAPSSSQSSYTTSERLDIPISANLAQPLTTDVALQPVTESQIAQAGLEEPLELIVNGRRMYGCPYHCDNYPLQERSFNVRQHVGTKHPLPNAPAKL